MTSPDNPAPEMTYDAITIDTQTVYANNRALDRGLVGQLEQYKDGLITFVISEIVTREIRALLITKAKTSADALSKAIKEGASNGQLSPEQIIVLQGINDKMATPETHANGQLRAFIEATNAHIVAAEKAPMKEILKCYFGKRAPFSSQGKKDEFPDAISLLSLEAWAKEENKKILAISNDGDWKAFAQQSEWIDCIEDLASGMSKVVAAKEAAETMARTLLISIVGGRLNESKQVLDDDLQREIEFLTPYAEFDGPMHGEDEGAALSLIGYQIEGAESGQTEITIVRVRSDGFVMRIPISVHALASADIHFSIYDSIDKDYVPMGSTSVERQIKFEAYALIDCEIMQNEDDSLGDLSEVQITRAELVGAPHSIDLGYVDYSLADEDIDFDPDVLREADDA